MATSEDAAIPPSTSAGFPDSLSHFMLVVVGEPLAEDYIDLILVEVEKGLKNWSIDGDAVEYNDVLKSVAEADPIKSGLVHVSFGFAGAHLGVAVLINPTSEQLSQELRGLLAHSAANKHVSFGGHSAEGTGDWVLHDDTYTLTDIAEVFSEPDVDAALLKASQDDKQTLCLSGCHWSAAAITKQPFSKSLNLAINPQDAKHEVEGVSLLLETIRSRIQVLSPFELMEPPTMGVGIKCKITKPTVLIFPAAKGDCAFFAVSDFSLFVGGGYSIKSCFWKFAKHLHRVDAVILPHTRPDSVIGINSLLRRKIAERQLEAPEIGAEGYEDWQIKCNSPEVGVVYMNAPDNKQSPKSLVLKTVSQGNETTKLLQQLSIKPFACTANGGKEIKPITLYLKVGIGKLDMYILSPTQDSKELKDFLQQWSTGKAFGKVKTGVKVNGKETEVPLPNACSICALMVWQPASPHENIVRVLFPGNAPQSKIIEGLDRVKHLEFLKYPDAVQSTSGKITAMKKKDVVAMNMKKAAAGVSGAVNGSVNGKTSQMKEANVCTDGVHCNTPPPSPTGICTDGKNCNTPPPGTACTDGVHCNTPPPGTVCTDGKHCNTPPPGTVCTDGEHCNTPPPGTVCTDGEHCNTPPPDTVCTDGKHCNTPPPGTICTDGVHCNTPPPGTVCTDGEHCNTPPPDIVCTDGKHCNTPPPEIVCMDGKHCNTPPQSPTGICVDGRNCNTPPPDIVCTDGKHCNTPPPGTVCSDGENCNTPPPDINEDDAANINLSQKPDKFDFDLVKIDDSVDNNRCGDGLNCNTPPPEDEYEQNGVNGNVEGMGTASGHDGVSFVASGDSQLPESQQGMESDVNFNPTSPALAKIDVSGVHGRESPERLLSGEITPADMVEYGMDEESDGLSSGLGTVGNTPDQPEPPMNSAQEDFAAAAEVRPGGSESPEIQSEQPSSGVEMEDASPSDHPHPWEPTIELSTDNVVESSPPSDVLLGSPEIQVTEPAEMISEAIDSEDNVGQQGALDASCELDESSEEISQASEIEVKPNLPEDDIEDIEVADSQQNLMQYGGELEEGEKTNTESALPEAEEDTFQSDMEPNQTDTDDQYLMNNAPESEQVGDDLMETTDSNVPAAEPEADQQVFAEESYAVESQFAAPADFGAPPDFGDETQEIDIGTQEIPKETDLDEVIKERDFDEEGCEAEGQEVVHETNLDEVESPAQEDTIVHETDLDEFSLGVQQHTEADISLSQEPAEEFGVDVTSAVEVEEVKQMLDQDTDVAAEVYGQSEEPEVDDAPIRESVQEIVQEAVGDVSSVVEVEEVKQMPDQDTDVAAEGYEQLEEPEVDDALIQESAQEIVQEAVGAAVGVVERDQMLNDDIMQDTVPDAPEDFGTDVDAGRDDIPDVEDPCLLEEGEVKEEAVSLTEPTISDSLEQNATDSLEDLQNEAASDVDIPPVIEEEVSAQVEDQQKSVPEVDFMQEATPAPIVEVGGNNLLVDMGEDNVNVPEGDHEVRPEPASEAVMSDEQVIVEEVSAQVEEQQESVPEQDFMQEATPAPIVEVGGNNLLVDMGEDNVNVPEVDHEVRPEPAVEPAISDEQVLLDHSSPPKLATSPLPLEEPTQEESKEKGTVLKEPEIMQESQTQVLESSTVQPEQQTQSTEVVVKGLSVAVTKSTKSSNQSAGKRSPSPTKSANKNLKDKDKAKKPTDKAKAADSRTKTGVKTSSPKPTEKKTAAKTPVTSKKTVLEKKTSSETKLTSRKSLVEKKPLEKKLSDKKSPAEKKQPSKTRLPPSSSRVTEKKSSSLASRSSQQESSSSTDGPSKKLNGTPASTVTKKKTSTLASTPTSRPGAKQPDSQRPSTAGRPASGAKKAGDSKKANDRPTRSAPSSRGDAKSNGTKKAGSASAKSATPAKAASIPASGPAVHLDLAYIPNHASADSINSEFFRRVRAKNYVMSANDKARNQPAVAVLDALLEGKMKWEDVEAEVTVIPTYDYLALREWELNKHQELSKAKIEISQPACRSIVQMKDENFFMYKVEL